MQEEQFNQLIETAEKKVMRKIYVDLILAIACFIALIVCEIFPADDGGFLMIVSAAAGCLNLIAAIARYKYLNLHTALAVQRELTQKGNNIDSQDR